METNVESRQGRLTSLPKEISADQALSDAATAEGLLLDDPNLRPLILRAFTYLSSSSDVDPVTAPRPSLIKLFKLRLQG